MQSKKQKKVNEESVGTMALCNYSLNIGRFIRTTDNDHEKVFFSFNSFIELGCIRCMEKKKKK